MSNQGNCSRWKAWHDHQPISGPVLHITATCQFPTPGYTVTLRPAQPQGVNPAIYIMDRSVTAPSGLVPQVITDVPVHYTEKTNNEYKEILILPDDQRITVEEVQ